MFYVSVCTVCLFENVGVGVCVWAEGGHILDLGVGGAGESVGEIEYGSFAWHCAGSRRERVEGILIEKIQEPQEQFIICNHNGSETQRLIARFEAEPSLRVTGPDIIGGNQTYQQRVAPVRGGTDHFGGF